MQQKTEKTVQTPVVQQQGTKQTPAVPQLVGAKIVEEVLAKINQFQETGELVLPSDYSVGNALRAAHLTLSELKDKDGKPALEVCSRESIALSLLKMAVQGLSTMKRQCSFIVYGNQLQLQREYAGNIALAKRYGGVEDVNAICVFEGDDFKFEIDHETGKYKVIKHDQSFENIDINKIKGAYAVVKLKNGQTDVEIMNMKQIRSAWEMGYGKGNTKAHNLFTDEMAKKTVINRALKLYINTSNDDVLFGDAPVGGTNDAAQRQLTESKKQIKEGMPIEDISFEPVTDAPAHKDEKPEPNHAPENKPTEQAAQPKQEQTQPQQQKQANVINTGDKVDTSGNPVMF